MLACGYTACPRSIRRDSAQNDPCQGAARHRRSPLARKNGIPAVSCGIGRLDALKYGNGVGCSARAASAVSWWAVMTYPGARWNSSAAYFPIIGATIAA